MDCDGVGPRSFGYYGSYHIRLFPLLLWQVAATSCRYYLFLESGEQNGDGSAHNLHNH